MIVKIWPIKADYGGKKGKVGGVEGLKNSVDYITDEEKTVMKVENVEDFDPIDLEVMDLQTTSFINTEEDFARVINYMSNEDKIEGKYISGYLCHPDHAVEEFQEVYVQWGENPDGNIAYHIVQSFPEDLDISDEEVHRCGIELCERIGKHQAVICSHVHPTVDEEGEVHGVCKHNHILINAYIHPSKMDPEHPEVQKYHDCNETYEQLRLWNDEIAIDHGLPIIRNPDEMKTYSWKESDAVNKGYSWKERIRMDIEAARRITIGWKDFVAYMKKSGYDINEGKHVTYTAPDGKHKARGGVLGRPYTKEGLELYWQTREEMSMRVEDELRLNRSPSLSEMDLENTKYTVAIPIGKQGNENRSFYYLPLNRAELDEEALQTYFDPKVNYDICDETNQSVYVMSGAELIWYYTRQDSDEARNARAAAEKERYIKEEEERRRRRQKENEDDYYSHPLFVSSKNKRRYKVRFYDEFGRQISKLEALFTLAIVVLRQEDGLWVPSTIPPEKMNEPIYAPTDWKVQNMLDTVRIAREEGITSAVEIQRRLNVVGPAYSRARAALKRNTHVKEKMQTLQNAISEYEKTRDVVEEANEMPAGPEKNARLKEMEEILERYKAAKAMMYAHGVTTDDQILDFKKRWKEVEGKIKEATERYDQTREQYRRLKKLEYNVKLAYEPRYCYGPEYTGAPKEEPTLAAEKTTVQEQK